ncbi:hypothetical protein GCM10010256_25950 [Streptomyces coeruleorubidus]|nr:hypothetical protein GCM10010256_25950 [Streptomyces coeruleorubidus]
MTVRMMGPRFVVVGHYGDRGSGGPAIRKAGGRGRGVAPDRFATARVPGRQRRTAQWRDVRTSDRANGETGVMARYMEALTEAPSWPVLCCE